jgi:hypothetical protein
MDPVVTETFDEMLKRMEDQDKRSAEHWEHLEKRFEDTSTSLQEREDAVDSCLSSWKALPPCSTLPLSWRTTGAPTSTRASTTWRRAWWTSSSSASLRSTTNATTVWRPWSKSLGSCSMAYGHRRLRQRHPLRSPSPHEVQLVAAIAATLADGVSGVGRHRASPWQINDWLAQWAPRCNDYTGAGLWFGHDHSAIPSQWYVLPPQL